MNRFLLPLGLFALLTVVLAVGIKRAPEKSIIASPLIGKPAPQFVLPSLTDPARSLANRDLHGRWYLFNVWGTWCVECRAEHDTLLQIRRSGLVPLIGLDWRDEDAAALQWIAQLGNPYESIAVDREGRVAIDWGVYGAPETFLVDDRGIVVHKHVGPLTADIWRQEFVPRIPRAAPATRGTGT
ncbi:MAG: DsbE family thiol:disulfide interchange protein [Steroidobacteraceae bacterium]